MESSRELVPRNPGLQEDRHPACQWSRLENSCLDAPGRRKIGILPANGVVSRTRVSKPQVAGRPQPRFDPPADAHPWLLSVAPPALVATLSKSESRNHRRVSEYRVRFLACHRNYLEVPGRRKIGILPVNGVVSRTRVSKPRVAGRPQPRFDPPADAHPWLLSVAPPALLAGGWVIGYR